MPTTRTVTVVWLADPFVSWPAIEFYFPAIPLAEFVSVGTVLLFALLAGLVGLNVGVVADEWTTATGGDDSSHRALSGSLAATGATACCCCAPAMYGVTSAILGAAATPVYWAFMDPTSPVGGIFFGLSTVLLAAGLVRPESGRSEGRSPSDRRSPATSRAR